MPTFNDCKQRLRAFLVKCNKSNVRFKYFSRDMKPLIAEDLSEWRVGGELCYIVRGNSEPWCYTYSQSSLKNVVKNAITSSSVAAYDPDHKNEGVVQEGGDNDEYGDHITIGVTDYKRPPPVLIMNTHKTRYYETDDSAWMRETAECNFVLSDTAVDADTKCYYIKRDPTPSDTLGNRYMTDPLAMSIIQEMNNIYRGISSGGARTKEYVMHRGNRYLVRIGKRGGKFIQLRDGSKLYIVRKQVGGQQPPIRYKTVGFSDVVDFVYQHVIMPVESLRSDLESTVLLYDEFSELADDANKQIVLMYDFRHPILKVFYLDALKTMIAYYAFKQGENNAPIEADEATCLQQFIASTRVTNQLNMPAIVV